MKINVEKITVEKSVENRLEKPRRKTTKKEEGSVVHRWERLV